MSETENSKRVHEYHLKLKEFQALQALVCTPSFNVDTYPDVVKSLVYLSKYIKNEADSLFNIGINVY